MQVKVSGSESRRRWICDEKARLAEEALRLGKLCADSLKACCSLGVGRYATTEALIGSRGMFSKTP